MLRESKVLIRTKMFADVFLLVAIVLCFQTRFTTPETLLSDAFLFFILLANVLTWLICARAFGLYGDLRHKKFSVEWIMFLKAFGLYALSTSFIDFQVFGYYPYGKHQFLGQCICIFFLIPVQKLLMRIIVKRFSNSKSNKRKVLIVGTGKTGLDFYNTYVQNHHFGYQLTGFLDEMKNPSLNGRYLGKTSEIDKIIAKHELDDIVVTLPMTNETEIKNIVRIADQSGKRVRIIPNYEHLETGRIQVDKLGNLSMVTLRSLPLDALDNKIYKRLFDIFFSVLVIVSVFSWLFPLIALLIKFTSKGPVFFKQQRWGLNNKNFACWKFRTMLTTSTDTNEKGKYRQATKGDPRITPIGRFLRKTSLDEMPQFLNVLLGSMSVVGPRPHPVPLNIESRNSVEKYMMRHWVKPGITGWAQVNGYRGETKEIDLMKKRVQHDLEYIEDWSFWLDLQIIVQTVVNVVKGEENAC